MRKIISKVILLVMTFSVCLNSYTIKAEEYNNKKYTEIIYNYKSDNIQTRSVASKTVKKAIRWAIRHSDDLVRSARKWIGKDAARIVEKNFSKAMPVLKELLKYDDLVWQTVQDQLTHVVGRQAAIWIRMALEWLL